MNPPATAAPAPAGETAASLGNRTRRERATAWLAVTPATTLLILLMAGPVVAVVLISLTDWQFGASTLRFLGIDNYRALFTDSIFWRTLANTLLYVAIVVPGTVILGLVVALLIEAQPGLRGFYRAAHFLPVMSTMAAMAIVWGSMLHPSIGMVNRLLAEFGITGVNWLRDERTVLPALAVIGIWQGFGFAMVLFVAGLKSIPQSLYDAVAIDGADGMFERLWIVTLPILGPVTMFVLILTATRAFEVFDTVRVLSQGGPNFASEVLLHRLYVESFDFLRTGYGAALTVVYLAIVMLLTLVQAKVLDRRVHYS
ncbi:carbohydrate ABC transporter permease [Rhodopseudomonas sp. P2A-2r]|uniref:carbohydrate ABC transporter permease n=1 Tax=unclassified Rhodopseudomonas TaxID=2638247 RepID=UPI00223400E9|nr:sugar ABC transporter permease [Rhodopseudomonas sp. P2A-2r]UZE49316.1 sugar ABC transporter permease [Rhodopseudomonas sp. P2A-2r]